MLSKVAIALTVTGVSIGTAIALSATMNDGATIVNSGSTNARGYTLKVWSDGTAFAVVQPESAMRTKQTVGTDLTARFFQHAKAAKAAGATAMAHCMKSASFGYSLVVRYHGWTSPDLTCPPFSPEVAALAGDVRELTAAAKVNGLGPMRRIPLPNDIRHNGAEPSPGETNPPAPTMAPRPSASPDASPTMEPKPGLRP